VLEDRLTRYPQFLGGDTRLQSDKRHQEGLRLYCFGYADAAAGGAL